MPASLTHAERSFQNPITLREHFRCVPRDHSISNDLCYGTAPLIPLRQAPPNRLPAMESRFIADGTCEGKGARVINRAEAVAVVEEIENVIRDDAYQGKSIGVIALQGHAQTHLIEQELVKRLPPDGLGKTPTTVWRAGSVSGRRAGHHLHFAGGRPKYSISCPYQAVRPEAIQRSDEPSTRPSSTASQCTSGRSSGPRDLRHRLIAYFENPPDPVVRAIA